MRLEPPLIVTTDLEAIADSSAPSSRLRRPATEAERAGARRLRGPHHEERFFLLDDHASRPALCRSLTWDRGKELSAHTEFTVKSNISAYFADPKRPWQRDSNENTNGLLRQLLEGHQPVPLVGRRTRSSRRHTQRPA